MLTIGGSNFQSAQDVEFHLTSRSVGGMMGGVMGTTGLEDAKIKNEQHSGSTPRGPRSTSAALAVVASAATRSLSDKYPSRQHVVLPNISTQNIVVELGDFLNTRTGS